MAPVNWWLTFFIALVPLAVGFVWYGPMLFHKVWKREAGITDEMLENGNMPKILGLSYLYSFLVVLFLNMVVIHQFSLSGMFGMLPEWSEAGSVLWQDLNALNAKYVMYTRHLHFGHGAMHGGAFGLVFVGGIISINGLCERKSWKYMAIHTGYWFVCLALVGGLLCQFMKLPLPLVVEEDTLPGWSGDVLQEVLGDTALKSDVQPPSLRNISSDGFGSALRTPSLRNLDFLERPLNSVGTIIGEVNLGLVSAGPYLFTVPQDADEIRRINTVTGEIEKIPAKYPRLVIPASPVDLYRDKFNGGAYDEKHVWIVPSWAAVALKINPDALEVVETFPINTYGDNAYNGAVFSGSSGRVYFVPHDSPVLKWIDTETEVIGETDLSMISGISKGKRSFLSGTEINGSVYLYPRSSTKIVEIDALTGAVMANYTHPLAGQPEGAAGYFHGGSTDGRYIYLNPWGSPNIVRFDTRTKAFKSTPHNLPGSAPWCMSSVYVDGYIYFPSMRGSDAILINTATGSQRVVPNNLPAGASGAIAYQNGKIWVVSAQDDMMYEAYVNNDRLTAVKMYAGKMYADSITAESIEAVRTISDNVKTPNLDLRGEAYISYEYLSKNEPVTIADTTPSTGDGFLFQVDDIIVADGNYQPTTGGAVFFEINGSPGTWDNGRVISNASGPSTTDGLQIFMSNDRLAVRSSSGISVMPTGNIPAGINRVAIRFTNSIITMYVNGVQVFTDTKNMTTASVLPVVVGNIGDLSQPLSAELRELVVYDYDPGNTAAIAYTNATTGALYSSARYVFNLTESILSPSDSKIYDTCGDLGQLGQVMGRSALGPKWTDDNGAKAQFNTASTDANGLAIITHTFGVVPTAITPLARGPVFYHVQVISKSATNFSVKAFRADGTPAANASFDLESILAF
jgi:hypothetical protein